MPPTAKKLPVINLVLTAIILLLSATSCKAQGFTIMDSLTGTPRITGTWRFLEILAIDSSLPKISSEADRLLGKTIFFSPELVALGKDSCFNPTYEEIPKRFIPEYQKKNYVTMSFQLVCGQCNELKLIQMVCKDTNRNNKDHKTGYDVFYISEKQIAMELQDKLFLLEKVELVVKAIPIPGDTVRCFYNETKTCTGFVIQGSRQANKVVHVTPANKKVPVEKVD